VTKQIGDDTPSLVLNKGLFSISAVGVATPAVIPQLRIGVRIRFEIKERAQSSSAGRLKKSGLKQDARVLR
jgi:hypothetical protein